MAYEPRDNSNTEFESTTPESSKSSTMTAAISAVLAVIVLALGGYVFYASQKGVPVFSTSTVTSATTDAVSSTKDAIAEVPQAIKDSTTKGDQDTTRPNKDGTTNQLDQKPAN